MEYSITRQAVALAQSGVQVLMFIETPRPPFNRYITEMRKAGVRFIAPGHLAYGLHTLNPRLVRMRGIAGDFARELSRHRPDAIHIHGWRFGGARESLRVILRRAAEHAIPAIYTEYAGEEDWSRPPNRAELALIQMTSVLSAASASARRSLLNALGENTHVTLFRHSAPDRPEAPLLQAEVSQSLRVFTTMSTPETLRLRQKAHSSPIQLDLISGPAADLVAGCHAALLNPALPEFGIALAEAMAQFVPVVIAGPAAGLPIVHRANGLVAADDPLDALMELAADPLLAHQFAIAARRTFEAHGLRDLAIVAEAAALYRPQLAKGAAVHAGC